MIQLASWLIKVLVNTPKQKIWKELKKHCGGLNWNFCFVCHMWSREHRRKGLFVSCWCKARMGVSLFFAITCNGICGREGKNQNFLWLISQIVREVEGTRGYVRLGRICSSARKKIAPYTQKLGFGRVRAFFENVSFLFFTFHTFVCGNYWFCFCGFFFSFLFFAYFEGIKPVTVWF